MTTILEQPPGQGPGASSTLLGLLASIGEPVVQVFEIM